MNKKLHCDIVILGGGAAGLSLASGAAQLGAHVILLESHKMGGDCLNYGCVPSKSLIAAAKRFWQAKNSSHLGVVSTSVQLDFSQVMNHVQQVIKTIAPKDSTERFTKLGVRVLPLAGSFLDPKTIKAGDYLIKGKRTVIATGSSPFIPPIKGLERTPYYTNETIFSLTSLPEHLIVIGGGPIGCELAQAFATLGSKVTLIEAFSILPKDDIDCVAMVKEELIKRGIDLHEATKVKEIQSQAGNILIHLEKEEKEFTIQGTSLLVATGRQPNLAELNLDKAEVSFTNKGIVVDKRLKTTNKTIYAIGDVATPYQFTHVASYHASLVLKNCLFWLPIKVDYQALPWVTYTEPQLAHVGLTTKDAIDQGIEVIITESLLKENDRALAEGESQGKIKILTNKKGRVLGATIVGCKADELIYPWVLAIQQKKTLRSFTDAMVPYPTQNEISKYVAGQFYAKKLFSPGVRTVVKWLLKLL